MSWGDGVLLGLLAVLLFFALRAGKKQLKHGCGGCSGDCSACPYHTDPTSGPKS